MKKFILIMLMVGCGKEEVLGSCLQQFYCIDFTDTNGTQSLNSKSTKYICDAHGEKYSPKICAETVKETFTGACELRILDGVLETYRFFSLDASVAKEICDRGLSGTFYSR